MKKQGNALGLSLFWHLSFTYPGLRKGVGLCDRVPKRISNGDLSPMLSLVAVRLSAQHAQQLRADDS